MISLERMKQIHNELDVLSSDVVAEMHGVSIDTILDYDRRYRKYVNDKRLQKEGAKILLFDIETNFMENATWNLYPKYIHIQQIIKDWSMISWSAKWLFAETIYSGVVTPEESIMRDDKKPTKELWELINEADLIIAHNLDKFDKKKMNTCFLKHNLGVPSPYQTIDTLKIARFNFAISSNKLDYLAEFLGLPKKYETGFSLWREADGVDAILNEEIVTNRNKIQKITTYNKKLIQKALDYMVEYNENDVSVLENIYLAIRHWDKRHPNLALYGDCTDGKCSTCGSENLKEVDNYYFTAVSKYPLYKCQDCGSWVRSRFAEKRSKKMLRGVAR